MGTHLELYRKNYAYFCVSCNRLMKFGLGEVNPTNRTRRDALQKPNQEPNLEKQRSQVLLFFATVVPLRIGSYYLPLVLFCILVIAAAHLP